MLGSALLALLAGLEALLAPLGAVPLVTVGSALLASTVSVPASVAVASHLPLPLVAGSVQASVPGGAATDAAPKLGGASSRRSEMSASVSLIP